MIIIGTTQSLEPGIILPPQTLVSHDCFLCCRLQAERIRDCIFLVNHCRYVEAYLKMLSDVVVRIDWPSCLGCLNLQTCYITQPSDRYIRGGRSSLDLSIKEFSKELFTITHTHCDLPSRSVLQLSEFIPYTRWLTLYNGLGMSVHFSPRRHFYLSTIVWLSFVLTENVFAGLKV